MAKHEALQYIHVTGLQLQHQLMHICFNYCKKLDRPLYSTCKLYILPNLMRTVSVSRGKSSVRSRPHPYSYIAGDPPKMTVASNLADSDTVATV